jgi:membrane dipeptidase
VNRRRWWARGASGWLYCGILALLVRLPLAGADPVPRPIAIVDLHVDLPYQYGYEAAPFERGTGQFPAAELLRAGVIGVVLPLFVPARVSPSGPQLSDLEGSYERVVAAIKRSEPYQLPGSNSAPGKVRTWLAFEGAAPLAERPNDLDRWVQRGVASVGLVHTRKNALASSSGDPHADAEGLTAQGRALAQRALELRVPLDISHASDRAARDVFELARGSGVPVIATHSDARTLSSAPRNLTDAQLRAIAASGGVVGVNFHSRFLVDGRRATLDDVVKQVRYLVRVAGVEHVAIGSDFEGDITTPRGLSDVRDMPKLGRALEAAGLSRAAVEQVFALNALRVLCPKSEASAAPTRSLERIAPLPRHINQ